MLIEKGAYFCWYFHYMPVGNDASPELLPSPEQRAEVYRRIRDYRSRKPLFCMDFQNDAEFVDALHRRVGVAICISTPMGTPIPARSSTMPTPISARRACWISCARRCSWPIMTASPSTTT